MTHEWTPQQEEAGLEPVPQDRLVLARLFGVNFEPLLEPLPKRNGHGSIRMYMGFAAIAIDGVELGEDTIAAILDTDGTSYDLADGSTVQVDVDIVPARLLTDYGDNEASAILWLANEYANFHVPGPTGYASDAPDVIHTDFFSSDPYDNGRLVDRSEAVHDGRWVQL